MECSIQHLPASHKDIICVLILSLFFFLSHNVQVNSSLAQSNETIRSDEPRGRPTEPPEEEEEDDDDRPAQEDPISVITGPDTIQADETVTVHADKSYDPDGGELEYSWTYESNADFQFYHSSESSLDITAPQSLEGGERVTISLVVTDNEEDQSETDTKVLEAISSSDRELIPVAIVDADDATVEEGKPVRLDGTQSYSYDPVDNSRYAVEEYEWTQEAGPQVIFNDQEAEILFNAPPIDQETVLTFSLYVHVEDQVSEPDSVSITVGPTEPEFPVAIINGPDRVMAEESVTLEGRESYDPEGREITTYEWTQTGVSPDSSAQIDLSSANSPSTSFYAPIVERSEVILLSLRVTAEDGDESVPATKQVIIMPRVPPPTSPPVAIIKVHGGNNVSPGSTVTLEGRESYDPEGREITGYRWTSSDPQMQPFGSNPTVTIPSVAYKPYYEFSLRVISDNGESTPTLERISVKALGLPHDNCQAGNLLSLESLGIESSTFSWCIPGGIIPWTIGIAGTIIVIIALIIHLSKQLPKEDERMRADEGMDVKVKTDGGIEF